MSVLSSGEGPMSLPMKELISVRCSVFAKGEVIFPVFPPKMLSSLLGYSQNFRGMSKSFGHDILERTALEIYAMHDLKKITSHEQFLCTSSKTAFCEISKYVYK